MKGKQLAILLALVVIIGGGGFILQKSNQTQWSETGAGAGGKVLNLPLNDVNSVTVKSAQASVNIVRKDDGWFVQERADYPANYERVSDLLRKLWDLKTVQKQEIGASQLGRMELIAPGKDGANSILVECKDKDGKTLAALLLGKKQLRKEEGMPSDGEGFPVGRYVMPVGSTKVSLVSETFNETQPNPQDWVNKDFVKVENPKSVTLAGTTDAMKWKVERPDPNTTWKLADAKGDEALDVNKVSSFGFLLGNPAPSDVLAPDAKPADTGLDKPTVLTIETFDGFTYTVSVGKESGDNQHVQVKVDAKIEKERKPAADEKPEDKKSLDDAFQGKVKGLETKLAKEKKFEGRVYLLPKMLLESALKERSTILAEKKPEAPAASGTPAAPGTPPGPTTVTTPPIEIPPAPAPMPAPPKSAEPAPPAPTPPAPSAVTQPATPTPTAAPVPKREPVTVVTPPITAEPVKPTAPAPEPVKPATPPAPVENTPPPSPAPPAPPAPATPAAPKADSPKPAEPPTPPAQK